MSNEIADLRIRDINFTYNQIRVFRKGHKTDNVQVFSEV